MLVGAFLTFNADKSFVISLTIQIANQPDPMKKLMIGVKPNTAELIEVYSAVRVMIYPSGVLQLNGNLKMSHENSNFNVNHFACFKYFYHVKNSHHWPRSIK